MSAAIETAKSGRRILEGRVLKSGDELDWHAAGLGSPARVVVFFRDGYLSMAVKTGETGLGPSLPVLSWHQFTWPEPAEEVAP